MKLIKLLSAVAILQVLSSISVSAELIQAGCTYMPSQNFLMMSANYSLGGLEGSRMYIYEKKLNIDNLLGEHSAFTVSTMEGQESSCTVEIKSASTVVPGKLNLEISTSKCENENFLTGDPQVFSCEVNF